MLTRVARIQVSFFSRTPQGPLFEPAVRLRPGACFGLATTHAVEWSRRPRPALSRAATCIIAVIALAAIPTSSVLAVTINIDFDSLPSMQQPSGSNWTYFAVNSQPETAIFHVGLNAANTPTLFQNSLGVGTPCCDANRYQLLDALDPLQLDFTLHVRAAVLAEELNPTDPNHFGFTFAVAFGGTGMEVGIGPGVVQVADSIGVRLLTTDVDNTGYHDYVLCGTAGSGGGWSLSRDGVELGAGKLYATSLNWLLLGDGSGGGNAAVEVTQYDFFQTLPQIAVQRTTSGTTITWQSLGHGVTYDLVRGDLDAFVSSGGNFTMALDAIQPGSDVCMANDTTAALVLDTRADPPLGSGWFYLKRCCASTYNSGSPRQASDRDPEIAASASACP